MRCVTMLLLCAALTASLAAAADIAPERRQALRYLIRQDCGSCHGMTLKGGLGPALTAQALAHRPPERLLQSILAGRPGTAMPPWKDLLSREEAAWIVDQLRRGMPD